MWHGMDNVGAGLVMGKYLEEWASQEEVMCNKGVGGLPVIVYARPGLERCVGCCEMVELP